jgi:hypothetical protein
MQIIGSRSTHELVIAEPDHRRVDSVILNERQRVRSIRSTYRSRSRFKPRSVPRSRLRAGRPGTSRHGRGPGRRCDVPRPLAARHYRDFGDRERDSPRSGNGPGRTRQTTEEPRGRVRELARNAGLVDRGAPFEKETIEQKQWALASEQIVRVGKVLENTGEAIEGASAELARAVR